MNYLENLLIATKVCLKAIDATLEDYVKDFEIDFKNYTSTLIRADLISNSIIDELKTQITFIIEEIKSVLKFIEIYSYIDQDTSNFLEEFSKDYDNDEVISKASSLKFLSEKNNASSMNNCSREILFNNYYLVYT